MLNEHSPELEQAMTQMGDREVIEFQQQYAEEIKELARVAMEDVGLDSETVNLYLNDDFDYETILEVYKDRSRLWVDLEADKVVGTIAIEEVDEETARLRRMFVLPGLHRQGIGQRLFDAALHFAREQKYKRIRLDTDKRMYKAHAFYEKNGFRKTGTDRDRVFYEGDLSTDSTEN